MTPESTIKDLQGQVLGLRAILISILMANPDIRMEDKDIGKLILELPAGDDTAAKVDIQRRAREVMHEVRARK